MSTLPRPGRVLAASVVVALVAGLTAGVARSAPPAPLLRTEVADLPAPFDEWNVTLVEDEENENLLVLEFDSAAVGLRATSLVWLPSSYRAERDEAPVAYFLHGQGDSASLGVGHALDDAGVPVPYPFARPGSSQSFGGIDPAGTADDRSFLLVGIDNGPTQWCGHCWYTDSVGEGGVDAERHLLEEVAPLVEALFRVRRDAGGRGILGNSMGANGSLLIGFRHPDRFRFVGALSPTTPNFENRALFELWTQVVWSTYLIDQGYGSPDVEPARWYALDPLFYAAAVNAAGPEVVTAIGDGCIPNDGRGICSQEPATGDPDQELGFRVSFDSWAQAATEKGVRFTNVQREGAHDAIANRDNFVRYFLPRMNVAFATPAATPERFSYRTVDETAEIYGWNLGVDRPNVETLHVLGARTDGTEITLAGTGTVSVTTPAAARRGGVRVVATPDGGAPVELPATIDAAGRVSFTVALGAPRTQNETRELVETGLMQFPHTTVQVLPA